MSYTTRTKVQQYMNSDLSAIDSEVTAWIASVKAWIDNYCGKTFEGVSETRYYDGNGKDRIVIDSFVGAPTVQLLNFDGSVDTTLVEGAGSDFVTYPLNTTEKYELVLMPNSSRSRFSRAFENLLDDDDLTDADIKRLIKVTATFGGSATVPADVELAATMLVAAIAKGRQSGGNGTLKSETLGDYSVTYGDSGVGIEGNALEVTDLLAPHVDVEL